MALPYKNRQIISVYFVSSDLRVVTVSHTRKKAVKNAKKKNSPRHPSEPAAVLPVNTYTRQPIKVPTKSVDHFTNNVPQRPGSVKVSRPVCRVSYHGDDKK